MPSMAHLFSVLMSPFDGTPDQWRSRSATALKELLGADYSMYSENTIGHMSILVADAPADGVDTIDAIGEDMARAEPTDPLVRRMMAMERAGQLPVYTTPLLDSALDGRFRETPFFRDVMEPASMEHIAGLVSVGTTAIRRLAVGWHTDRRIKLGAKTLDTLRLVHSAFDAACRLLDQAEQARRALLTVINDSNDGMALVTPDGVVLHRNPVLRRLIRIPGELDGLDDAIAQVVTSARRVGMPSNLGGVRVRTCHGDYAVRGSAISATFGIPPGTILTTISEVAAHLPLAGEIERRFGLTRRQAEVARLLAGRLSDAEIATRLGISWHTVRSHTDRVLRAIGVHTRQEIVERITSLDDTPPV